MNKRLILLLSIITMAVSARLSAQTTDSGVEIRLNLVQGIGGWSIRNLALSVSIINHTDSDVYIPGLRSVFYADGINLYREEEGKFVKIDIEGIRRDAHPVLIPDSVNAITSFYWENRDQEKQHQDSLILAFCRNNHLPAEQWKRPDNQPLFLKAGKRLDNFAVFNIDHTWKKAGQYKIVFDAKSVDQAYSPAKILGYQRFPSGLLKGNVLYFSDIVYDQMGKN